VILDVRQVDAIDASAVRSLFVPLVQLASSGEFGLGIAGLGPRTERLFAANGAPLDESDHVRHFADAADAIDWARRRQLAAVPDDPINISGGRTFLERVSEAPVAVPSSESTTTTTTTTTAKRRPPPRTPPRSRRRRLLLLSRRRRRRLLLRTRWVG